MFHDASLNLPARLALCPPGRPCPVLASRVLWISPLWCGCGENRPHQIGSVLPEEKRTVLEGRWPCARRAHASGCP